MSDRSIEDYCYYQSPIGLIRMAETEGFLTRADFVEQSPEAEHFQSGYMPNSNTLLNDACTQLDEYFEGKRRKFDLALKSHGTDFQRSAWKSLLRIPYGETRSYLQQAESISNPRAIRAIGQANSRNPISIIIPCHRVIGKNGSLTGYAGGLDRKTRLLALEHRFMHEQNY
ncbi:MAG: methylated-DNA--[protein]-cysteine S-methyltransferase [SAR324 cluster bacterium]|nr:methylated-DNA--[protein]-cysteine S-methyltransferase [SAR324 cluster bacterium]